MKILGLFLVQEIRTGGHVRYLELMESLAAHHDVAVILNEACGYRPTRFRDLPFLLRYRRKSLFPHSLRFLRRAWQEPERIRRDWGTPDMVLIFGETSLAAGTHLARSFGAPLVYASRHNSVRNTLLSLREDARRPLRLATDLLRLAVDRRYERRIARVAARIVFQSPADEADFLSRNHDTRGRTFVVRGDICQPRFKEEYAVVNRAATADRLLFVGTLGPRKGLGYLLEALALLERQGLRPTLDVLAPLEGASVLQRRAADRGLASRVFFRGRVADPFPYLREAGLLVVPSIFDSYPNTILEALHAGCPVIGAATGGIPDMLRAPELLFPARDAAALADRLQTLLLDAAAYRHDRALCAERRPFFVFDWTAAWLQVLEGLP